jgi:outer membrane lipoprotein carrier protein
MSRPTPPLDSLPRLPRAGDRKAARRLVLAVAVGLACSLRGGASGADTTAPAPAQSPAIATASATAPQAEVAQAVGAVQAFYDKSLTFKAKFQQRFWVKAYNTEKSSSGRVTFAKPGRMDWVYDDPKDNRVVSDGSMIRVYEADKKQMFEQPIAKSQYPAALSFLTGTGRLGDAFEFQMVSGQEMKFPGGYVLVGTPKESTAAYSKVLFYVDSATSQVRRVMIIDGQGNRNRFDFLEPHVNESTAPGQFTFTPPTGTSVIRP